MLTLHSISTISHLSKVPSLSGSTHTVKDKNLKINFLSQPLKPPLSRILPIRPTNVNTLSVKNASGPPRRKHRETGAMAMRAPASRDRDGAGVTSHKYLPISRLQRHAVSGGPDLVLVTVQWFRLLGLRITSGGCASAIAKGNSPESRADPARRPTTLSHELQRSLSPNSPSRARTCDLAVNSRSLYQLSYRGIHPKAKVTKRVLDNLDRSIGKEPDSNYFVKIYLGLPIQKNRPAIDRGTPIK